MTRSLAIAAFLIGSFGLGTAHAACVPFGGDDSGCIPPDTANFKYESKVGKNLNKYQKCILKCHEGVATGKLGDQTAEENCEAACKTKYDASNAKLTAPPEAACLNTESVRAFWAAALDLYNGQIYCDGSTPFGGDDTGNIPSDSPNGPITKCEKKVGSNVAKLLKCQGKCHEKRAKGSIPDETEEEVCEDACTAKYTASNAKLTGCPGCLNTPSLGTTMRTTGDGNNGSIYCAM
ncbi:MAG TPA: hypothetical protein VKA21_11035 [Candidatus Binatia bacterium]|nr:hypothetical protein [Candidatus Binatia bacterium]